MLHLIKSLTVIGGAEQLLLSLTAAGDGTRFDYHVAHVLTAPSREFVEELRCAGVGVQSLGASSHFDLRWVGRLRRLLVAERIDVLHLHLPYAASLGRLVARSMASRPAVVHTEHSTWGHHTPVMGALYRLTYPLDDVNLAVSRAVWEDLPPRHRARTEVLVHGVPVVEPPEPSRAREEVRSELGCSPEEVLIVTVANMRREKGYEVLLGAAKELVDAGLPVRFVAVGGGPLEEEVRSKRDALGLGDSFLMTGFRADARRLLAGADVFVLASHYEGFPISVMEALFAGVPVVSTAVGDVAGALGDGGGGVVVPVGDSRAMAAALRELVLDPERRAEHARAALETGAGFDIRRTASRLEEIYESLVRAKASGRGLRRRRSPATPGT